MPKHLNYITLSLSGLSRPPAQRYHAGPWPTAIPWPDWVRAREIDGYAQSNRKRGMPSGCAEEFTWPES